MGVSNYKQRSLATHQLCSNDGINTVQKLTKTKTILIDMDTHKKLKAHCLQAGLKIQAVADKAILAWLRKAEK